MSGDESLGNEHESLGEKLFQIIELKATIIDRWSVVFKLFKEIEKRLGEASVTIPVAVVTVDDGIYVFDRLTKSNRYRFGWQATMIHDPIMFDALPLRHKMRFCTMMPRMLDEIRRECMHVIDLIKESDKTLKGIIDIG